MRRVAPVRNYGRKLVIGMQRSALFFLSIALVFGLIEPGIYSALAQSNASKQFRTDYKIDPLSSKTSAPLTTLTESNGPPVSTVANPKGHKSEDTSKRTPYTSTYINNDGTETLEYSTRQLNYDKNGSYQKIDNKLNTGDASYNANFWDFLTGSKGKETVLSYKAAAGDMRLQFMRLDRGVEVTVGGKTFTIKPDKANAVTPTKTADDTIVYRDAWQNVDLEYQVRGEALKETIVIKAPSVKPTFSFTLDGAKSRKIAGNDSSFGVEGIADKYKFGDLSVDVFGQGVQSETRATQVIDGNKVTVSLDSAWYRTLPSSSFPLRIDPGYGSYPNNYWMFKSDGYSCGPATCYANTGTLYDNGWKSWRSYFQFPVSGLDGKKVLDANIHGYYKFGIGGDQNVRGLGLGHANCISYWCQGTQVAGGAFATSFDMNITGELQNVVNNRDWGAVWSIWGEEGAYLSYKPYSDFALTVVYDTPTPIATAISPDNRQVIVDTQPTLKVNPVADADGDTVQYYFRVSTSADAETGAVINSGWVPSSQWTVPEGVLQDGTTYYWHVYTLGATQTTPNWINNFKVDLRTGRDSTQSYDTVGPVGIDLATGNAALSAGTHTMSALGGSMGLSLSYNTPNKAQKGLSGEYWNVGANYNYASGVPKDAFGNELTPTGKSRDQNIDFNWATGVIGGATQNDWVYARWTGQFIAPVTGSYQFGGSNDDSMHVWVNGTDLYNQACYSGNCYGGSITLTAGQVVPLRVEYLEATGAAYAKLYVKGAVPEQTVPREWLYTNIMNSPQGYGLTGRYYTDNTNAHDLDAAATDPSRLMIQRQDTKMNLNFGLAGPAQGLQVDNFMARWTGYITVPTAGSYTLGAGSDDGIRIKVNTGSWQTPLDSMVDHAGTYWGSAVTLPANTPIPIQVDWYEHGGGASINLRVQGNGYGDQEIPVTWLTPDASALPSQWKLGIDVTGSVAYERLRAGSNSVILEDSTGSTHEYTYTSGGYKPPVHEDGILSKNTDNSYTFIDTDGRTYIFDASGKLTSVTSPTDDRQPAALKYTYAGDPSRLTKIEDGTTSARYATVYYKGINDTGNVCDKNGTNNPSSFFGLVSSFSDAPTGKLCAFSTSDGNTTNIYYDGSGNLARIVQPGGQITDYAYDSFGRITDVRDSLAADVIAAGIRTADTSVLATLQYDSLGRIVSVKAPAATAGGTRLEHKIDYTKVHDATVQQLASPGVSPASTPISLSWGPGRIDMFARGASSDLVHRSYSDGVWSGWESLGGCMTDDPTASSWAPGRLDVFIKGCSSSGNNIYHRGYDNGAWNVSYDQPVNSITAVGSPSAVSWGYQRIDYTFRGSDNKLYQGAWTPQTGWVSPADLGGCLGAAPKITSQGAGLLDIYVLGCESSGDNMAVRSYRPSGWQPYARVAGVHAVDIGAGYAPSALGNVITARRADGTVRISNNDGATWSDLTTCATAAPSVGSFSGKPDIYYLACGTQVISRASLWQSTGTSTLRITDASEPNGFSKRMQYDNLLRTTTETDLTGKSSTTEWDPIKDLQLSKTDATGLKSTTIYDQLDRATDSYGPAPSAWFGADRRPIATQISNTSHTSTAYDESIQGLAVTVFNNSKLLGAPKLYTTAFNQTTEPYYALDLTNSTVTPTDGLSMRATGKVRLDQVGTYTYNLYHGAGARLYIDNQLIVNDWTEGPDRFSPEGTYNNTQAGKYVSVTIEAHKTGTSGTGTSQRIAAVFRQRGPGVGSYIGTNLFQLLTPAYNLTTSTTAYDSQLGNVTSTTQYANPAYGTVANATLDPTGLNYTSQAAYEAPGTGYLRQTSKTLPGGAMTTYQYYGGGETADNPCTVATEAIPQAGMSKGKLDATGGATTTIYDLSGRAVATRSNSDPWTCTTYDARGRIISTAIPFINGKSGRTISNNYAVGANPLIVSTTDETGTITTESDLLGRTVRYTDAKGNVTTNTYDDFGKFTQRVSPVGTQTYIYDQFDRLTTQKLDGVAFATITYDDYSRIQSVQYPAGISLQPAVRDALGRVSKLTYNASGQSITDEITQSTSGVILSGVENGVAKSYAYDKADRLIAATIGTNTFNYGFGTPSTTCTGLAGSNTNAGKDSNRTSYTLDGQTTTYCYNSGDQLISSSDARFTNATYDSHGNTTSLGDATHRTEFTYDGIDRNTGIRESTGSSTRETVYQRDVSDRVFHRTYSVNGSVTDDAYYGFSGSGDTPDFLTDANGVVTQKYLSLVGGVMVTIKPQGISAGATTYSLTNIHGDTMATVNADGTPTIVSPTGPFGELLMSHVAPTNAALGTSTDYLGANSKATETDYLTHPIQMGARVYIAELGRFLQVDPVEGGTLNMYVYAQDPVNQRDLNGKCVGFAFIICLAVLAAVAIAGASKNLQNNPQSPGAWIGMGLATSGVGSIASSAASSAASAGATGASRAATQSVTKAAQSTTSKQVVTQTVKSVGSKSAPLMDRSIQDILANQEATIYNRIYTDHALNAMQNTGIYPMMVESTISSGVRSAGNLGRFIFKSDPYSVNPIVVITEGDGTVVTTYWAK